MAIFGYSSGSEFANSFLGINAAKLHLAIGGLAGISSIITGYIYNDHIAIYTLWILYTLDFITGVGAAWYTKTISSTKFPRILVNITAMTALVSVSWWMAKSNILFVYLPGVVMGGAYSTLFISLIENLSKLEVLPPSVQKIIKKRFGLSSIEDKLFGDDSKPA